MSIKAMAWAWDTKLKGCRKLVLIALADHSDDDGNCWPGLKGLAKKCGISRSSVIEHVNALEEMGFIFKSTRSDENGRSISNIYNLNFSQNLEGTESGLSGVQNLDGGSPESGLGRVQNLDPNHHIEPSSNNKYINNNKSMDRKEYEKLMKCIDDGDIFTGVITE
jgi:biotin operon repressor